MRATVTIVGTGRGILLSNGAGITSGRKSGKREIPSPEVEAAGRCYWTEDKSSLAFPGENIRCGLVQAASGWKVPRHPKLSLSPIVSGDVDISPDMIPFNTTEYRIDTRRAVVQRQGILRSRPWLPEWALTFGVEWETQYLGGDFHEGLLPELLKRLGETIGLGDFRPAKKGRFGKFAIKEIQLT